MAHGSAEVRQLLERWGASAARLENADVVIRMADESRDPGALGQEALKEKRALEDYRKAMRDAADAIRDQMRLVLEAASLVPGRLGLEQDPQQEQGVSAR
jgi:hypothetical protein